MVSDQFICLGFTSMGIVGLLRCSNISCKNTSSWPMDQCCLVFLGQNSSRFYLTYGGKARKHYLHPRNPNETCMDRHNGGFSSKIRRVPPLGLPLHCISINSRMGRGLIGCVYVSAPRNVTRLWFCMLTLALFLFCIWARMSRAWVPLSPPLWT